MPFTNPPEAPTYRPGSRSGLPATVRVSLLALLAIGLLASLVAVGSGGTARSAAAVVGYRDHAYSSTWPENRGTNDKPQSKLWYTDGSWFGSLVSGTSSARWTIHRLNAGTQTWTNLGTQVDASVDRHGDYLWVESAQTLYAVSTLEKLDGDLVFHRFGYNPATDTYTRQAGPVTAVNIAASALGPVTATIARDSTGKLWIAYPGTGADAGKVMLVTSADNGVHWGVPFGLPVQGELANSDDTDAIIAFGSGAGASVGVMWNDSAGTQGTFFAAHLDSADEGTWGSKETAIGGVELGDDHMNLKLAADGRILAAPKTHFDGNPNTSLPQILLLERSSGGTWRHHVVSTVAEDHTRPQLLISDELEAVWVFLARPAGGGSIYVKSASFADLDADDPGGTLAFKPGLGATFIDNAPTDKNINDPTTTKQNVSAATEILVEASDRMTRAYFHGWMPIAATDTTAPTGSVSIGSGAAATKSTAVTLAVPAADAGSGVSQVEIWNAGADGTLTCGTKSGVRTLAYNASIAWTLPAGDGTKRVCARWRDTLGHWTADGASAASDTIVLDTVAPTITGSASPAANGAGWRRVDVTVSFSCADDRSGIASCSAPVVLSAEGSNLSATGTAIDKAGNSKSTTLSGIKIDKTAPTANAAVTPPVANGWNTSPVTVTLSGSDALSGVASFAYRIDGGGSHAGSSFQVTGNGSHTIAFHAIDIAGNAGSDKTVTFKIDSVAPAGGAVSIDGGAGTSDSRNVSLLATAVDAGSGMASVQVSNAPDMSGATTFAYTGVALDWTLTAGDGTKTVYARFRDAVGNMSPVTSDTIVLDTTTPPPPVTSSRLAGANRFATAAAISKAAFPTAGVPVAYIATGLNFPDALAGSVAAARAGGPILLVTKDSLPADTKTELARLKPAKIVVLGGTGVVSESVRTAAVSAATP